MSAVLKFQYIRSPALMALYRTIPCQHCGVDDGTVVGAHSNQSNHGKGRGIKAGDQFCASLCADHHAWLDYGSATREAKNAMWGLAHYKTTIALENKYGDKYLKLIGKA